MSRARIIGGVVVAALVALAWYFGQRYWPWLTPELFITGLVAVACVAVAGKSALDIVTAVRASRPIDRSKLIFGIAGGLAGLVGVYFYWKGVLHLGHATLAWKRQGAD